MLLPLHLIATTLLGILSLVLLATGFYALYRAYRNLQRRQFRYRTDRDRHSVPDTRDGAPWWKDRAVVIPLALGLLLPLFSFGGRFLVQFAFPPTQDEPHAMLQRTAQQVKGASDTNLYTETVGPANAPVLLFTHGWGMDNTEWYYAKRDLSNRFRLIFWDLPGLGKSGEPQDRDFSLDRLAQDLRSVVATANGKPVILVGHSIGGMINLTFCRLFPDQLGRQVVGIIQVDTSYTNPVKTTENSSLSLALQKPVGEPILHAMIGLSPLVRLMNWLSYENGTSYLMNAKSAFAGAESRGQVDLVSRLQAEASPAVVARGTLAMFHWDATPVLPRIPVPVLLLVGRQDTTTLPEASRHMKEAIPGATIVEIDRGAHYSLLEQNQLIDSAIGEFAQKLP